mgnify:CR=1 FL=1
MATSLLGLYWSLVIYSPLRDVALAMAAVRKVSVWLFVVQFPELGRAVWFVPGQIDWHMLCVSLALLLFRRHVAGLMAHPHQPRLDQGSGWSASHEDRSTAGARGPASDLGR